jgi:hypothetical protein
VRRSPVVPLLLLCVALPLGGADAPAPKAAPPRKIAPYDGPEIRWARSWRDARDEAAERGLPIFLHSHGST